MIDSQFMTILEEATVHTLKTMASVDLLTGKVSNVKNMTVFYDMVSSCISLEGSDLAGVMLLSIPEDSFRKILLTMMGEVDSVEENLSLSSELLNMIHGRMKTKLSEQNRKLLMARPRILKGRGELDSIFDGEARSVPFVMDEKHGFFITVISTPEAA